VKQFVFFSSSWNSLDREKRRKKISPKNLLPSRDEFKLFDCFRSAHLKQNKTASKVEINNKMLMITNFLNDYEIKALLLFHVEEVLFESRREVITFFAINISKATAYIIFS
jgi:hypothetical protein